MTTPSQRSTRSSWVSGMRAFLSAAPPTRPRWRRLLALALLVAGPAGAAPADTPSFTASSTVAEALKQHARLPSPAEEVWWMPAGEDMHWNNRHLMELFPSVPVYRDGPVRPLAKRPDPRIGRYLVQTPRGAMPFQAFLDDPASTTMGVVILHHGKIAFEHYPRMQPYERPIWWSVSKVFASSLVAELEDAGRIDVTRPVEDYVPDLKGTEFGGVTVRNVLDMASGVDCSDGAYARGTCYYEYEATLDDAVRTAHTPDTPYAFLRGLHAGRWAAVVMRATSGCSGATTT